MMTPTDKLLYMRYLGVLALLGQCSVQIEDQDLWESIERAMTDACAHHPLRLRKTVKRLEIEPIKS